MRQGQIDRHITQDPTYSFDMPRMLFTNWGWSSIIGTRGPPWGSCWRDTCKCLNWRSSIACFWLIVKSPMVLYRHSEVGEVLNARSVLARRYGRQEKWRKKTLISYSARRKKERKRYIKQNDEAITETGRKKQITDMCLLYPLYLYHHACRERTRGDLGQNNYLPGLPEFLTTSFC